MSQLEVYLTIDRGLVTVEGGLGVKVVALGAGDPAGEEGVSTVGQLVTPALKAPDTLSCNTTVIIIIPVDFFLSQRRGVVCLGKYPKTKNKTEKNETQTTN